MEMPDVELLAACDVGAKSLEDFAARFPKAKLFSSAGEMLSSTKLDAVSVCTPNGLHHEHTIAALKAGCHVMVEKPMAMSARQAEEMQEEAGRRDRKLVIGFQHRFDGRISVLRRAFDEGMFGKVLYVRVQALRRRGIPNWGVFGRKDLQGGGPMIDIGVHCLEMAHYAIGLPTPVAAVGSTWTYLGNRASDVFCQWPGWDHAGYTVEDLAVGRIRMSDGSVIAIEAAFAAHIEQNVWSFQIFGEKGGATFDPLMLFHDHAGTMMNCTPGFVPKVDIFKAKMRDFVDVCLYGRESKSPGEHGVTVQRMLDGVYRSAEEGGREVTVG
jgi:predicted dehydrogenase